MIYNVMKGLQIIGEIDGGEYACHEDMAEAAREEWPDSTGLIVQPQYRDYFKPLHNFDD